MLDGLSLPWPASSGSWSARCEAQGKPKGGPFHPGGRRRGKIGRANTREPLVDASLSEILVDGTYGGVQGRAAAMRQAPAG